MTFPGFFDFADRAGTGARVLVHCELGVSRSATLATAHVMKTAGEVPRVVQGVRR